MSPVNTSYRLAVLSMLYNSTVSLSLLEIDIQTYIIWYKTMLLVFDSVKKCLFLKPEKTQCSFSTTEYVQSQFHSIFNPALFAFLQGVHTKAWASKRCHSLSIGSSFEATVAKKKEKVDEPFKMLWLSVFIWSSSKTRVLANRKTIQFQKVYITFLAAGCAPRRVSTSQNLHPVRAEHVNNM